MLQSRVTERKVRRPWALAAELLRGSSHTVVLTGAGVSTPSGIPDFRSRHSGLWERADPMDVASIWGYHDHPERFYEWFGPVLRKSMAARPNGGHAVFARMETAGRLNCVITQNVDSLHQAAGSRHVLELHGHTRTATCLRCGLQVDGQPVLRQVLDRGIPDPCPACNGLLKPDVRLFGEPLSHDVLTAAQQAALECDVMLIAGTSLEVMPAADLPLLARRRGARLILINRSQTPLDDQMDVVLRTDVVRALRRLEHLITP